MVVGPPLGGQVAMAIEGHLAGGGRERQQETRVGANTSGARLISVTCSYGDELIQLPIR